MGHGCIYVEQVLNTSYFTNYFIKYNINPYDKTYTTKILKS